MLRRAPGMLKPKKKNVEKKKHKWVHTSSSHLYKIQKQTKNYSLVLEIKMEVPNEKKGLVTEES